MQLLLTLSGTPLMELVPYNYHCIFISCLKPNSCKLPDSFTPEYLLSQLKYTGVLETTRIRRQGYSVRIAFDEFLER